MTPGALMLWALAVLVCGLVAVVLYGAVADLVRRQRAASRVVREQNDWARVLSPPIER